MEAAAVENPVVLTSVLLRTLGEPIAMYLEEHGITAIVRSDDCGGLDPALAFSRGVEIHVAERDLPRAERLLAQMRDAVELDEGELPE